jgi:DNA invertase Pin-like site-specific DNA recombinase
VFCDLPHIPEGPQGKYIITIMAGNAEMEGAMTSQRTKAALAQSKKKLWGRRVSAERFKEIAVIGRVASAKARAIKASTWAEDRRLDIEDIKTGAASLSLRQIAAALNERGILTARGTDDNPGKWSAVKVKRILDAA